MRNRTFQLDSEWNMIHYPIKPTGFGVLIIGDDQHYVDKNTSFWNENEAKRMIVNKLIREGYTVFYSNLYGKHWGSKRASGLAKRLYEDVIRKEILNQKIHIIADGMGALVAMTLVKEMGLQIRSIVFINPILSLKSHLLLEKNHQFFYKKLLKEISQSYEKSTLEMEADILNKHDEVIMETNIPIQYIHVLKGNRSINQTESLNNKNHHLINPAIPPTVCVMLPEKAPFIQDKIVQFLKQHERNL